MGQTERDLQAVQALAEHARAALEATGETALAADRSSAVLDAELGAVMRIAPQALLDRIAQTSERVLEDVAFGRNQRAIDRAEPLLAELDPFLAAIGRLPGPSADLSNLCLHLVRAEIQKRDLGAARTQAEVCLRLIPDLAPDASLHPPEVIALMSAIRQDLVAGRGGSLALRTGPTDPTDCVFRVQGREYGHSAWEHIPVVPGSYSIQVECVQGAPGRVVTLIAPQGDTIRLTLRARLLGALVTAPMPALAYESSESMSAHLAEDVASIGQTLHVQRVLVAVATSRGESLRAFAIEGDASARLIGSAPVAEPLDLRSREAVQTVVAGRSVAAPGETEQTAVVTTAASDDPVTPRVSGSVDVGVAVLGGSFVVVGLGGLGVGWYFWDQSEARGRAIRTAGDPSILASSQRAFDEARTPLLATSIVGASLSTVGLPLLLPPEDGVPWWSWVIGAAGLSIAGVGVWQLTESGECYGSDALGAPCARRSDRTVLGTHILMHAAPLLSVPIIYGIRALVGDGAAAGVGASIRLDETGGELRVYATF